MATKGTEYTRALLTAAVDVMDSAERALRGVRRRKPLEVTLDDGPGVQITVHVVEDKLDGGYVSSIREVPGCMSQGETAHEAVRNVVTAYFEILTASAERRLEQAPLGDPHTPRDVHLTVGA